MLVSVVFENVPMRGHVMRDVFVYWSDMLAGFMAQTVAGRRQHRIVLRESFVVSRRVRFVGFTAGVTFEKTLATPKRHRHQSRHEERGTDGGNRADQPDEPTERNLRCRRSVPQDFVFGPETAERNHAADREPAGEERPV